MITAKAVMDSLLEHATDVEPLAMLSRFRRDFHACCDGLPAAVEGGRADEHGPGEGSRPAS